jgi:membrane protein implicated in regulation of membrane protease activity
MRRPSPEFRRYLVWQVPGWVLAGLVIGSLAAVLDLSWWVPAAGVALFVVRDLAMYPLLRSVFRPAPPAQPVGARGVATEALRPSGYVRIRGELWRARASGEPVAAGSEVTVTGAHGLTLLVEPTTASR